jgi:hypothetical protein
MKKVVNQVISQIDGCAPCCELWYPTNRNCEIDINHLKDSDLFLKPCQSLEANFKTSASAVV